MFQSANVLKYLVLVMLGLMTIAIGSFFFGSSSFRDRDVLLTLSAPTQASSGAEVQYVIEYQNNTKVVLKDVELRFFYPEESVIIRDGSVKNEVSESFKLDQLQPGEVGKREFRAYLVGNRGDVKNTRATMTFRAGTIRSLFEKSSTSSLTITEVPVALTLVAPPHTTSGQSITYMLDYRNESDGDISDVRLEFTYPEGFTPQSYQPAPTSGNSVWDIPVLRKSGGSRISVTGILSGSEQELKRVRVALKRNIGSQYVDYQRAEATTSMASPILSVDTTINDSRDYAANLGDLLRYRFRFKNNSSYNLLGVVLSIKLEGDMYDFNSLSLGGAYFDDTTKTVFWNATSYGNFVAFTPGMQGDLSFSLRLRSDFPATVPGASRDRFVKATVKIATMNVPQGLAGDEVATTETVVTRITSQPTFNQFLYYQDAQLGGAGPFPPTAGEETTLTVRWQLANPGNDIAGAEVSGVLPPGVTWLNVTSESAGQPAVTYNPNTSTVSWKLGSVPFGVGTYAPRYEAAFQVKIRPVASQRGNEVEVVQRAQFSGSDKFTGQPVLVTRPLLDTGDVVDKTGQGKVQ